MDDEVTSLIEYWANDAGKHRRMGKMQFEFKFHENVGRCQSLSSEPQQKGLSLSNIQGGGHTAAESKPEECFAMFKRWISYQPL
ncbi:Peptidase S10, serine carboxypeptidase [Cynara cardunculus var. scolymus]|uniref:Peptidase S10, serine carboxypeptidase n=1 Tax=Cynara cardunculus var. scolymus TaxID=59895 RepID=A0A124SAK8_CYNCS|nr:Peptidase S10, serine carboxypeptidase [Cynara cardunculus var. scolymus]